MAMRKLRTTHCLHCGTELKTEGGKRARIDRTYCAESCRVLAYRVRRQNRTQPDSQRTPKQKEVRQPLLHKALSALAELQAQIVGIGHALREEESAEQKHDLNPNTVAHEAEAESLRRQLSEVTEKLQSAQSRITELEGIVSSQADRIRKLEAEKVQNKTSPAAAIHHAMDVISKELTREEERWLSELGTAIQSGYDPHRDPLVECKFEEICAEQDLVDAFEQVGQVSPVRLHRRGLLLFPMAVWAAKIARQKDASQSASRFTLRNPLRFGELLNPSDEDHLRNLSAAQKRDLERMMTGRGRR